MKNNFKKIKHNKGAAMLFSIVFFLFISLAIISGLVGPSVREFKNANTAFNSKKAYFLSESGSEDAAYRVLKAMTIDDSEVLIIDSNSTVTTINTLPGGIKDISSLSDVYTHQRKTSLTLSVGSGVSFNYGVQIGDGGLYMKNLSSILGNVFTTGSITTDNSPSIFGDAISAGPTGLIDDIFILGDVYANTIDHSFIIGDAYYQNISSTIVIGTKYPGSIDQSPIPLPIPDTMIEEWKDAALAGGTSSTCAISSNTTLGPIKLNCSKLTISGSPTITLEGPVWVGGDIEFQNSANIVISGSLGSNSVAIIAHDESDESGSGQIVLKNSVMFSGSNDNYILMVSMNNDAEANGGSTRAIQVENSVDGDVLVYAPHGVIELKNSVDLKEVTAYELELQNTAQVIFDAGLVNLLFTSGPSGGFTIKSWKEVE